MPWNRPPRKDVTARAKANAPRLRKAMTDEERKLWWHLRSRIPLEGTHFRRQVAIGPFVADFVCLACRLVVEVDGAQHGSDAALAYDARRDAWFAANGYRVLRFSNADINREMDAVLDTVYAALLSTTPTPYPSPQGGGDIGGANG